MNYLNKKELKTEIKILQDTGEISESLTQMIDLLTFGIAKKYGKDYEPEELQQDCWLLFLKIYQKIDLTQNPFSYLTTIFIHTIYSRHRRDDSFLSLDTQFEEDYTFEIPEDFNKNKTTSPKIVSPIKLKVAYKKGMHYFVDGIPLQKFCRDNPQFDSRVIRNRIYQGWNPVESLYGRKTRTKYSLEYKGKTQTIMDWSRELGIPPYVLRTRLHKGWSVERILFKPLQDRYLFNGENLTFKEWSRKTGIPAHTISGRISQLGWTLEKALTTPIRVKKG